MDREKVAKRLVELAKDIVADDGEFVDQVDEQFASKVRMLRGMTSKIVQKKRKRLGQLGIGVLRQNSTVEDLVDALLTAASS